MVRFFTPESRIAKIRLSGMPTRPNPPERMVMPSESTPSSAACGDGYIFFMSACALAVMGRIAVKCGGGRAQ
jgi:hypothetical protein